MQKTKKAAVYARRNSILIGIVCVLSVSSIAAVGNAPSRDPSQAIIAYGFMRWGYLDLDKLFASGTDLPVLQNLKALDVALKSLDCDVPMRLASHYKALILPSSPTNGWVGFSRSEGRNSPDSGWLFVIQPSATAPQRVLVVFSTASPEHTTVFWLDETEAGYTATLLYDSFKKGKITSGISIIGAATGVKFENGSEILLRDRGEPGVGPREFVQTDRVFRLDLLQHTVTLVSAGAPPQH